MFVYVCVYLDLFRHRCSSEESVLHSFLPRLQLCVLSVSAAWTYQGALWFEPVVLTFVSLHVPLVFNICFLTPPPIGASSCSRGLGCAEWGQSEACACGSRPPQHLGARGQTGLHPQRERGRPQGLHVPVRTWTNEPIRRQLAGTKGVKHKHECLLHLVHMVSVVETLVVE